MQPAILNLQIDSVDTLRQLYMPFISGGGLFLPSSQALPAMGHEFFVILSLPRLAIEEAALGRVVWLRERGDPDPQRGRRGYGVQLCTADNRLHSQLENLLSARLQASDPTFTM